MYWGDAALNKIEKANLDGTGRTTLLQETNADYFAFVYHAGSIYFTDWASTYDQLIIYFHQRQKRCCGGSKSACSTGWTNESKPDNFCNNFVYCQPIFIIFGTYTL